MDRSTTDPAMMTPLLRKTLMLCLVLGLVGCASSGDVLEDPGGTDFKERIQQQSQDGLTVRAGVPSAKEAKALFGIDLYKRGVQPVWLEIENQTDQDLDFMPVGLDPTYFTPIETANIDLRSKERKSRDTAREQALFKAGMGTHILAGTKRSGFVFSRLDEGTKAFNVDVLGEAFFRSFTFFIPVPGLRVDHYNVDWAHLYPEEEILELDQDELIEWLEKQVCCTTDKDAEGSGDPVNLVIIGSPADVYVAFIRAGWDETETITAGSSWKTMKSFIGGGEYRYSPVSGLYVFGRPQDVAFQKARDNIHERNHLRLWMSPVRYQSKSVWLGQISRDIGVRFTKKTITTHKIDPDVDETREYLLENLAYAQALEKFAYVGGVGEVPISAPAGNLTGDPWFSDGMRLVMWVGKEPVNIHEVTFEYWQPRPESD